MNHEESIESTSATSHLELWNYIIWRWLTSNSTHPFDFKIIIGAKRSLVGDIFVGVDTSDAGARSGQHTAPSVAPKILLYLPRNECVIFMNTTSSSSSPYSPLGRLGATSSFLPISEAASRHAVGIFVSCLEVTFSFYHWN